MLRGDLFGAPVFMLDGAPIKVGRRAAVALLAYLLVERRTFRREQLALLLWPDASRAQALNHLRRSLYTLNRTLGARFFESDRTQIALSATAPIWCDVTEFRTLATAADGDVRSLEQAADLAHGDFLAGFTLATSEAFDSWQRQQSDGLRRQLTDVLDRLSNQQLQAGRYDLGVSVANRWLQQDELDERAHRRLMRLYHLAGDRKQALRQYDRLQTILDVELGVEPSQATAAVYEAVRRSPQPTTGGNDGGTPARLVPLIGRQSELAAINWLLVTERRRLVTLLGVGGAGKTSLAQAVGSNLPSQRREAVFFVDLAPCSDRQSVAQAIAEAVGYRPPDSQLSIDAGLINALRSRQLLLILDNFEHLLPARVAVVADSELDVRALLLTMLERAPGVTTLVTSRRPLNLAGETLFQVHGLALPDDSSLAHAGAVAAVQLFVNCAQRRRPAFALTERNVAHVVEICRLVDGVPLAIVLAAAWITLLTPEEIATEIKRGLNFLAADLADLPARQRSLQVVFNHSWQLLTEREQAVLAGLSIFRAGFTREAAAAIAGADLPLLHSLVVNCLLTRSDTTGRFRMHELLRQFAAEIHLDSDGFDAAELAHCRYFAKLADGVSKHNEMWTDRYKLQAVKEDAADIRRAWRYAVANGLAVQLAQLGPAMMTIMTYVPMSVQLGEVIARLRARGVAETSSELLTLRLLFWHADSANNQFESARELIELIPILEQHADADTLFYAYHATTWSSGEALDVELAIGYMQKALRLRYATLHELRRLAIEISLLALQHRLRNVTDQEAIDRSLVLLERVQPYYEKTWVTVLVLALLSRAWRQAGQYERAVEFGRRRLAAARQSLQGLFAGYATHALLDLYVEIDDRDAVCTLFLEMLDWFITHLNRWEALGFLMAAIGDYWPYLVDPHVTVQTLAMAYHHPESIPGYLAQIDGYLPGLKREIGAQAFADAWQHGRALDFESAVDRVRREIAVRRRQMARSRQLPDH